MMDQREAWRFLAKKWDNPIPSSLFVGVPIKEDGIGRWGLCGTLRDMRESLLISYKVHQNMRQLMNKYKPKFARGLVYWWSRDTYGAEERAAFCRKMAKICYTK